MSRRIRTTDWPAHYPAITHAHRGVHKKPRKSGALSGFSRYYAAEGFGNCGIYFRISIIIDRAKTINPIEIKIIGK